MIIEYAVKFKHESDFIVFCGEFTSVEQFEKIIKAPGSMLFKGYQSHKILYKSN